MNEEAFVGCTLMIELATGSTYRKYSAPGWRFFSRSHCGVGPYVLDRAQAKLKGEIVRAAFEKFEERIDKPRPKGEAQRRAEAKALYYLSDAIYEIDNGGGDEGRDEDEKGGESKIDGWVGHRRRNRRRACSSCGEIRKHLPTGGGSAPQRDPGL